MNLTDMLGWEVDSLITHFSTGYRDSICARAILFGVHESLAKAIANMNLQVREHLLLSIRHECEEYNRSTHDSCSASHQDIVEQAILDWVQELNERVGFHAPYNSP